MKSTMHIGILVSRGCSIHLSPSLLFYIIFHFRIGNSTAREPISNFPHYNFSQKSKNNKEVANIHLSTVKVCKPTQKHMTCISSNVITNENFHSNVETVVSITSSFTPISPIYETRRPSNTGIYFP